MKCADMSQRAARVALFMCRISCVLRWVIQQRTQEIRHIKSATRGARCDTFYFRFANLNKKITDYKIITYK